jgi:uncharacterized membrane protein YesL
MVIRSFKEASVLSYRNFKWILILNVISVLPVYIFLILASRFLFDTVFVSKKALVVISRKETRGPVWIVISQKTEGTIILGVTEHDKKHLVENIKENKTGDLRKGSYRFLDVISDENRDNIRIKYNNSSINFDIKYIKTGSTLSFKVRPHSTGVKTPVLVLSVFLFFLFSSLILPISSAARNFDAKKHAGLMSMIQLNKVYMFKSILINLVYYLIFIISFWNINYLKNHSNIFLAIPLVINFWILVLSVISYIWAFPIASHFEEDSVFIVIKKAFLITFDNLLNSILFIFLLTIFTISLVAILTYALGIYSAVVLFMFPGITGILLLLNVCFKNLMEKY